MGKLSKITLFMGVIALYACTEGRKNTHEVIEWKFEKKIQLENISPIGIVSQGDFLWLSDVDNNRVVKIDINGKIVEEYHGFQRPMHIALQGTKLYVPEYTSDTLKVLENGRITIYRLNEKTDAIGGVAVNGDIVAIADFYNNRILLQQGSKTTIIGKEGHNDGELYYPTDVALKNDLVYVGDAYNNRVQVFGLSGNFVRVIGWNEGIKVATGLKVTETQVIVADFEGNRVLMYDHKGKLLQILDSSFNKPTDIEVVGNKMYIVNYAEGSISVFENAKDNI